jgi:hypothetical protein
VAEGCLQGSMVEKMGLCMTDCGNVNEGGGRTLEM